MSEDLFCKIYVSVPWYDWELTKFPADKFAAKKQEGVLVTLWAVIDVSRNPDSDRQRVEEADGFLWFPFFVETEPLPGIDRDAYVAGVGELLTALWKAGAGAVASCDFEVELPFKGGFPEFDRTPPAFGEAGQN